MIIPSNINLPDYLICMDNTDFEQELTIDNLYMPLNFSNNNSYICVKNDKGKILAYPIELFNSL